MTHSPPIPPGNQSTYPTIEPPHAHGASDGPAPDAPAAKDRNLSPALIAGVAVAGVVAAAAAGTALLRSRRASAAKQSTPAKRPARKPAGAGVKPANAKAAPAKGAANKPGPARKAAPAPAPASTASKRKPRKTGDDKTNRGPQDASRIAMGEDYEVRYWTEKFGVDRDKLQRAVDAVGNGAAAVEKELGKS